MPTTKKTLPQDHAVDLDSVGTIDVDGTRYGIIRDYATRRPWFERTEDGSFFVSGDFTADQIRAVIHFWIDERFEVQPLRCDFSDFGSGARGEALPRDPPIARDGRQEQSLRPCPFCRSADLSTTTMVRGEPHTHPRAVECNDCGIKGPGTTGDTPDESERNAWDAWDWDPAPLTTEEADAVERVFGSRHPSPREVARFAMNTALGASRYQVTGPLNTAEISGLTPSLAEPCPSTVADDSGAELEGDLSPAMVGVLKELASMKSNLGEDKVMDVFDTYLRLAEQHAVTEVIGLARELMPAGPGPDGDEPPVADPDALKLPSEPADDSPTGSSPVAISSRDIESCKAGRWESAPPEASERGAEPTGDSPTGMDFVLEALANMADTIVLEALANMADTEINLGNDVARGVFEAHLLLAEQQAVNAVLDFARELAAPGPEASEPGAELEGDDAAGMTRIMEGIANMQISMGDDAVRDVLERHLAAMDPPGLVPPGSMNRPEPPPTQGLGEPIWKETEDRRTVWVVTVAGCVRSVGLSMADAYKFVDGIPGEADPDDVDVEEWVVGDHRVAMVADADRTETP